MFTSGKNKSAVIYTFVLVFLCQILRPFHLSAVESSLRILVAIDQVLWYVDLLGVLQAEEKLIHQNKDHLLISTYSEWYEGETCFFRLMMMMMMMMVIQCPSISLLIRASKILQFTGKPWEGGGVVERSDAINAAVGKVNHSSLIHSKIICSAKYWFIWVKLFYMSDGSLICVYIYTYEFILIIPM